MQKTTFSYLNLKVSKGPLVIVTVVWGQQGKYLFSVSFHTAEAELTNFRSHLTWRCLWSVKTEASCSSNISSLLKCYK